jgi:orotate phosphoribosyltransferase
MEKMNIQQEFIEFMLESRVLMFGTFVTKSGRKTPYFINTGNYTTGHQLQRLGGFYATAIEKKFGTKVTNLFGPAYKGIPISTAAGIALFNNYNRTVSVSFNRKEVKNHGEGGWLLGHQYGDEKDGDNVVIVEDVTTAGTSIRECLPSINRCRNTRVIGLVVSVDREEKGKSDKSALQELQEEYGIKTVSLINFNDILAFLTKKVGKGKIPSEVLSQMMEYREKYGV